MWCKDEYNLNALCKRVPLALASVSNITCLSYYHQCQRKMDHYREDIACGLLNWKKRTTHHRPTNTNEDR